MDTHEDMMTADEAPAPTVEELKSEAESPPPQRAAKPISLQQAWKEAFDAHFPIGKATQRAKLDKALKEVVNSAVLVAFQRGQEKGREDVITELEQAAADGSACDAEPVAGATSE